MAILELREAIPRIVSRFKLHPASTQAERAKLYGTALVPDAGARVVLELRT